MKQVESPTAGRVLVVDDEVEMLKFLAEALPEFGYEIRCSTTAFEALEALKQQNFDLLLTDMKLPGMDGIELLRAALEIDPNLVGIVMTAYASLETAVEAMRSGAFDYITKPFESARLLPTLSRAMEVHRLRLENIHLREIMAIYDLAQTAAFPLDDNAFLNQVTDALLRQCQGDEVSVMLPTPDGQALHIAAAKGKHPEQFVGATVPVEEGVAGWVARNRQSLMLYGTVDDSRFKPINPRPDIHTALSMPMMAAGNLVGIINVNVISNCRPFQPIKVKALTVMVSMLASFLHGSRLFRDLSEAQDKYRSIFESTGNATMIVEKDATISLINKETEEQSGYSKEELEGKRKWTDFVWQGDLERMREYHRLRRTDPEAPPTHYEAKLIDKQGKVRDFYFTVGMIPGTGKSVVSMLDITLRKQTEEAVRKSEAELRAILDATPFPVALVDTQDDNIDFWSRSALTLFGHTAPTATEWYQIAYPDPDYRREAIDRWKPCLEIARESGRPVNTGEYRVTCSDGSVRICELCAAFLEDRLIVTFNDITERKKAQTALQKSEEKYRSIFENAIEGIFQTTPDSRIIDANPALVRMYGYDSPEELREDIKDLRVQQYVNPTDRDRIIELLETQGVAKRFETRARKKNGDIIWVSICARTVRDGAGQTLYYEGTIEDITERKKAEEALRESEEHYRSLFDNMLNGFAFCRMLFEQDRPNDYIYLKVNTAFEGLTGLKNVAGKKASEVIPGIRESDPGLLEIFGRVALTGMPERFETYVKALGMWISTSAYSPLKEHFVAVFDVITERKRAEEALRVSEEKYRSIFENALEGIFQTTPDGEYLSANPALARMYGYDSPEELMEVVKDIRRQQYVNPADRDRIVELLETQGFAKRFETRARKKNGDIVCVSITGRTVRDGAGQVLHYEGMIEDITERKKAEEALKLSEEHFRRTFDEAPIGAAVVSLEGYYQRANRVYREITGYTEEELVSLCFSDITHPDDREEDVRQVRRLLAGEIDHHEMNKRYVRKDGTICWIHGSIRLIKDSEGRPLHYLPMVQDITERKQAEEALQKSEATLHSVIFASPVGIALNTAGRHIVWGNQAMADICGYTTDELRGQSARILYDTDEEFLRVREVIYSFVQQGSGKGIEARFRRKDGEIRDVQLSVAWLVQGEMSPDLVFIAEDITDRKKAGEALRESEERYRSLFENSFEGVLLTSPDGRIWSANPGACRMLGYTEDELVRIGRAGVVDFTDPRLAVALAEREGIGKTRAELTFIRKDGARFEGEVCSTVFEDKIGNLKTSMVIQDVTERKLAEEALRVSEEKYRSIFENAIEGIFQSTPRGTYLSVNPALVRMYGYESADDLIHGVEDIARQQYVNPEDRMRFRKLMETEGFVEGFETEFYKKNDERVWISITGRTVRDGDGKTLHYEGTAIDISERKQAEAQRTKTEHRLRRQSERLRALSKKLAQIDETERHRLARELHDRVGGNLTALGINLNILKRQLSETIRPAVHSRLDDTLVLLAETVERVRDVMSDLRPSVLDDYGLVAALRWYSGQFSLRTGIKVNLVGEELEVRLESYVESALYRIAQEALTNIAKHARASSAEIKWEQRERKVKLAVSDDGVGFSHAAEREDRTVQGWGLLIMKERAKALVGGTCTIGPGPEGGTVVMVEVTI